MYYLYKNCDLVYKCKTRKHAIRKTRKLVKYSDIRYHLIELFYNKRIIYYY